MIKERVDKDYSSVFRSALTSVSKVNKTDVETLRSSIGVRPLSVSLVLDTDDPHIRVLLISPMRQRSDSKSSQGSDRSK